MCGILGTNFKINNFKMALTKLKHRGPDNQTIKLYKNFTFGHTRLSIIDLESKANQPMEFDNLIIVFNGEIYNYKEIISKHKLQLKTKSDTEVIIRLYQKYGKKCLNYLNGIFVFTIFDKNTNRYFCARDRFGKKPFFYYFKNNKFIFSSEIKSILSLLDTNLEIDYIGFEQYLRFSASLYDKTIYQDIHKLPAGYYLELDKILKIRKYYDINKIKTTIFDEKEALEKIESTLIDSLKLRLVSDVEVASLLSGGVDSSLISAMYSNVANKQINTFSIGYDEYLHYSELDYARIVSKHINSNHHEIIFSKQNFLDTIDEMIDIVDEPFGDSATIPLMMLSKHIHNKGIKVALSGEGSDENFLGYDNYFRMFEYYKNDYKKEEFNLTKEWEYQNRQINNEHIFYSTGEAFTNGQLKVLLNKFQNYKLPYDTNYPPFKWVSFADFKYWIENVLLTKVDRAGMANSIEIRAPFLDYKLIEISFSIDEKIKKANMTKYLLKKIASKYLPKEIVYRKKKGFSFPFLEWLFDEYKSNLLNTILEVNKEINYFDEQFIVFLYDEAKKQKFKQHFYNIYIFARWYKRNYL